MPSSDRVLLTGLPSAEVARLLPTINSLGYETRHIADHRRALALITKENFAVVIAGFPLYEGEVQDFVAQMRRRTSRSVNSGLMLLSTREHLSEASSHIGQGVNKTQLMGAPPEVVGNVVNILANPRNPLAQRHRFQVPVAASMDGKEIRWMTEDVSAGGLLIRCADPPAVGSRFYFTLKVGKGEIKGEAKVVRHTDSGREQTRGFGARFCAFTDGRSHLAELLRGLRQEST